MALIRGKDTAPELVLRRMLHVAGFRYRLHVRALPGTPDIVLKRYRTVVLVHGCFWHHHGGGCKVASRPKTNTSYWLDKFATNIRRDRRNARRLRALGWQVLVVWECQLATRRSAEVTGERIMREIAGRVARK